MAEAFLGLGLGKMVQKHAGGWLMAPRLKPLSFEHKDRSSEVQILRTHVRSR